MILLLEVHISAGVVMVNYRWSPRCCNG